jgi:hypothetical protein
VDACQSETAPHAERLLGAVLVHAARCITSPQRPPVETDSNYGELFSLWDGCSARLTRLDTEALRAMRPGLGAITTRRRRILGASSCCRCARRRSASAKGGL